jgi:NADP-dependent 3-hydroxy acid dehydrogenase YdfG
MDVANERESQALDGQRALVLGASGGIGSAIAVALGARGVRVIGQGRDTGRLDAVAARFPGPDAFEPMPCDLADAAQRARCVALLGAPQAEVDLVVLAAGRFQRAPVLDADDEQFDRLFATNVRGQYALLRAALPGVIRRRGQVVIVSSSAAMRGRPGWAQYSATQAALRSLGESLRDELNPLEVRVLVVYPGRTDTEVWRAAAREQGEPYHGERLLQPDDIARSIVGALCLPRTAELTDLHIRPFRKSY